MAEARTTKKHAARSVHKESVRKEPVHKGAGAAAKRTPAGSLRAPRARRIAVKPGATTLFDVPAEVGRVVSALGSNTVADVLGVARSQPTRWRKGAERISPTNRARLSDLDHVLNRLLQVLYPEEAGAWLTAHNPHLGGRPVDVLALRGAGPVIEAIDALAQGAYA